MPLLIGSSTASMSPSSKKCSNWFASVNAVLPGWFVAWVMPRPRRSWASADRGGWRYAEDREGRGVRAISNTDLAAMLIASAHQR